MKIDEIKNGIVIDHITAGKSMDIYHFLNLDLLDCSVAIIKNAASRKMGKKDIIKIDNDLEIDMNVLGYIDPNVTINIIKNRVRTEKRHPELPERIENVIKCKNPRCITSQEPDIPQIFKLTERENRVYRCIYCESRAKSN